MILFIKLVAVLVYLAIMAGLTLGMVWLQGQMSLWSFVGFCIAFGLAFLLIAHLVDRRTAARARASHLPVTPEGSHPPRDR